MSLALSRCQSCRHQILDAFAALAGVTIKPLPSTTRAARSLLQPRQTSHPTFSTTFRLLDTTDAERVSSKSTPRAAASPLQSTNIPWYLQVETPTPPAPVSPHLALQEIPPLPQNAPPILLPMLTHLSTQMGLDNLSILDLRDVHPPPALGANLLMILGTARSYKHLNTSADRFCRWLRTKYKLQPYADGLLGRNELKLKLRRKARRMKLAQSVGNTVAGQDGDDGITTGWVCVNVGSVEDASGSIKDEAMQLNNNNNNDQAQGAAVETKTLTAEEQEEIEADEEEEYENPLIEEEKDNYVGFGSRSLAPRVVVQMFTEDKRLEMDLEGLWDVRKERRGEKAIRADVAARQRLDQTNENGVEGAYRPFVG